MIERALTLLSSTPGIAVEHLPFQFTTAWDKARTVRIGKVLELLAVLVRLLRLRAREPIDLIIFPIGGPHLIAVIRDVLLLPSMILASDRVVLNIHAGGIAEMLPRLPSLVKKVAGAIYGRCDGAIVLTDFGRADALALGISNTVVVPNTIPDRYSSEQVQRVTDRAPSLLYVGHLGPDKGTPDLLRAFARVVADHPGSQLVLLGEPIRPYSFAELSSDLGELGIEEHVSVRGVVVGEEKDQVYASSDLFVFPSIAPFESFPLVILEAMMWALPIVVTDWRAHREILGTPPGGICFDPRPDLSESLRSALLAALESREAWESWGALNRGRFRSYTAQTRDPFVAAVEHFLSEPQQRFNRESPPRSKEIDS